MNVKGLPLFTVLRLALVKEGEYSGGPAAASTPVSFLLLNI